MVGFNPSHTACTIIEAEAHKSGPVYLHRPPLDFNMEFRLGGLRDRSKSPPAMGDRRTNPASCGVAGQVRESNVTAVVVHRSAALSQPVSRVLEAARTGASSRSFDLVPGGISEEVTERRPGREPAYGRNSSREGYFGMLEEHFCNLWASLHRTLGGRREVEDFKLSQTLIPTSERHLRVHHPAHLSRLIPRLRDVD